MESEKDLVDKMLRAVLQSNKHGVTLGRLPGEYKSLTGDFIPFKEMGFHTLELYLKSIPRVVRIEATRGGEVTCHAVACKETAHVAELVARQRSSKKKSGGQVNCQMRIKYSAPVTHIGKPKATLRKPGFSSPQERNLRRPVPSAVRNKGAVYSGRPIQDPHPPVHPMYGVGLFREVPMQKLPPMMNRCERKVILPPRFQREGYLLPMPLMDTNANETHPSKPDLLGNLHPNVTLTQKNLRELFNKYSNGIWISKLPQVYRENFKQELAEEVLKQIPNWAHLCTTQKIINSGQAEMIIFPLTRKPNVSSKPQRSSDQPKSSTSISQPKFPATSNPPVGAIADAELKQKISVILVNYTNGLWSHALPKVFEDTYKKKIPAEVLKDLKSLSDICTVDIICEDPYKAILYAKPTVQEDQNLNILGSQTLPQEVSRVLQEEEPPSSKTEDLTKECDLSLVPPKLVIPSEASPSVLVVELTSTNEVVIRYVGKDYSAAQESMEDAMKDFYSKGLSPLKVGSVKVGQLVAAKAEDDTWLRAQITSMDNKLKVCYVDYGFSEVVEYSKIYKLDREFYALPLQASKCRLAGLEAFCEDPVLVKAVESKACGKILAVEILQKTEKPLVVLYDTSGDDDININAICLKEMCDSSLAVQLKLNVTFTNVIVTNVCSDGTLYCQVPCKGLGKLCDTLQKIQFEFSSKLVTSELFVSLPFCGKICLFHCKGKWARVEITSVHSSRALDVKFLDSGTIASVKVSDLREIPSQFIRDIISIPPQALKCCLADLPLNIGTWTPDAVLWLRNKVLNCSDCSIKIERIDDAKSMVHIFLFTSKNCLDPEMSINRLITNGELWKHQKDVFISVNPGLGSAVKGRGDTGSNTLGVAPTSRKEQTNITKKSIEEQSSSASSLDLPPPLSLAKPGEHMDVFVSVACHPGHFVFQPWQELHKLEVVMEEMLLYYSSAGDKPVNMEKNKVYAAKVQNKWYRVLLKGILTNGLVSVYELDYGRHELVNYRKVQPLLDKFRQLPFQAVTSQLAGVKSEQWSEEASIVFRNHVENKPLVALVQSVLESTNSWDRKVVAYIVDTSLPDTDVWIHNLMSEYLGEMEQSN